MPAITDKTQIDASYKELLQNLPNNSDVQKKALLEINQKAADNGINLSEQLKKTNSQEEFYQKLQAIADKGYQAQKAAEEYDALLQSVSKPMNNQPLNVNINSTNNKVPNGILEEYRKQFKIPGTDNYKKGYNEIPGTNTDKTLSFPSKEDVIDFFEKQAKTHSPFVVYDTKNNIICSADEQGNFFRYDKNGKKIGGEPVAAAEKQEAHVLSAQTTSAVTAPLSRDVSAQVEGEEPVPEAVKVEGSKESTDEKFTEELQAVEEPEPEMSIKQQQDHDFFDLNKLFGIEDEPETELSDEKPDQHTSLTAESNLENESSNTEQRVELKSPEEPEVKLSEAASPADQLPSETSDSVTQNTEQSLVKNRIDFFEQLIAKQQNHNAVKSDAPSTAVHSGPIEPETKIEPSDTKASKTSPIVTSQKITLTPASNAHPLMTSNQPQENNVKTNENVESKIGGADLPRYEQKSITTHSIPSEQKTLLEQPKPLNSSTDSIGIGYHKNTNPNAEIELMPMGKKSTDKQAEIENQDESDNTNANKMSH